MQATAAASPDRWPHRPLKVVSFEAQRRARYSQQMRTTTTPPPRIPDSPYPDTDQLPPRSRIDYRHSMENATTRRNHAAANASHTNLFVVLRLWSRDRLALADKRKGVVSHGRKLFGFVAGMCHSRYISNAKTTRRRDAPARNNEPVHGQGVPRGRLPGPVGVSPKRDDCHHRPRGSPEVAAGADSGQVTHDRDTLDLRDNAARLGLRSMVNGQWSMVKRIHHARTRGEFPKWNRLLLGGRHED